MKTSTLFTLLTLMTGFAPSSHATSVELVAENEQILFLNQLSENDSRIIQPAHENALTSDEQKTFLGRITNSSTSESISIFCSKGSIEACEEISFYKENGIIDAHPFSVIQTSNRDQKINHQEPHYSVAPITKEMIDEDPSNASDMFIFPPIGEITFIVDQITALYRLPNYLIKHSTFTKAKQNLNQALHSGSTVMVSNRQYLAVFNLLQ